MKKKVYLASNVGMEYFLFLSKVLEETDFQIKTFYYLNENYYRVLSRGSLINRLNLRLKMYLIYPVYLFICGLSFTKNSIFLVSSGTFYTPFLMQFLLKFKNIKIIQILYDLYPDILEASELIKPNSFASNVIGKITKKNQTKSYGTVYLGSFLKDHAERRWGKAPKSTVIDIATDVSLYKDHLPRENRNKKIIIHYGGQLGQAHDVDSLIECLKLFYRTNLMNSFQFNFTVSGSKSKYFRNMLKGLPVEIVDTVNGDEWRKKIKNYQIGLVGLMPAGASICLPSKTYSMMAGGLAILAVCPIWSDLSKLISENDCGWIINNSADEYLPKYRDMKSYLEKIYSSKNRKNIAEEFVSTLENLKDRQDLIFEKRKNAYLNVRDKYNIQNLSSKWNVFLNSVN